MTKSAAAWTVTRSSRSGRSEYPDQDYENTMLVKGACTRIPHSGAAYDAFSPNPSPMRHVCGYIGQSKRLTTVALMRHKEEAGGQPQT
ncbi:hypothetical protein K461DRAFT_58144 [Myriangium duriaei CBS 260.36]|uniref:Uncharacterized protein n=1 Tax=Myriangium duriaei CBS 260.36 TaxID=1168546 RepID=A0A9P4IQG2_9PEZI|nr:hypothetical protein K461DRAFT_58144 [Myriangium duriaei CBS 260.36]